MKDRKFVTVDEDELRKRIDASAENLKRRAGFMSLGNGRSNRNGGIDRIGKGELRDYRCRSDGLLIPTILQK
jgi:hypothetical protein